MHSYFAQRPTYTGGNENYRGDIKSAPKSRTTYSEAERDRRAALWYARHPVDIAVSCAQAWPPIELDQSFAAVAKRDLWKNAYLYRRLSMN